MSHTLLEQLNSIQQKAVIATDGPILILAGAGSGKTRVLTFKTAYLISEKKVNAENILLVTFTNKAAGEMKNRLVNLIKDKAVPYAGTFHALCAKILRLHGSSIAVPPNFLIYDDNDTKDVIKEIIVNLNLDKKRFHPSAVAATISQAKNELISYLEYPQIAKGYFQENVAKIYIEYQKALQKNNSLDFDDLLSFTVTLLTDDKNTLSYYQNKYQYILVDEYQDTNHAQYTLTKLLSGRLRNICVVGDASQSIYAWRGADYKNILNFKKDYPACQVFHLEQNYRSTSTILDAAYNVVSKNNSHPILKLWTDKNAGDLITLYAATNEQDEAIYVINQIADKKNNSLSFRYSDVAILYRTNAQSRVIEEALLHAGIPYILVGGVRFYERKEIKDVLSYLRCLYNSNDKVAQKRIEKLGKKRYADFFKYADNYHKSEMMENTSTLQILDAVLQNTSYLSLYDTTDEEDLNRLDNIKELRSVAEQFPVLGQFLENIALVEQEYMPDHPLDMTKKQDAVTLMTLHAAKGLEFKIVFIIGMEEGLFPHSRSLIEPLEIEEERRLCYVGITRAMEKLYFTFASRRLYFGQRNSNQISRFLMDIPKHLTEMAVNSYL